MALLLAVLATFSLSACAPAQSKLIGSWKMDMALTAARANIALPPGAGAQQSVLMVFEADGKYRKEVVSEGQSAVVEKGTFTAKGPTLKFAAEMGGSPDTDTMLYEVDDKAKTLRLENEKNGGRLSAVYFRRQ